MKALAVLLLLTTPALAWTPPEGYEKDFATARECKPVKGRKVWVGGKAYYRQANMFWTDQSGLLDDDAVSAIDFDEASLEALAPYAEACRQ